jgi:uncharacterized protein with von Willebrand factor type A (vWA) domain
MKARIAELIAALRRAEVPVNVAEAMDAARAATMAGVARSVLRDALAATLVKDERDRSIFLAAFDTVFSCARPRRAGGDRPEEAAEQVRVRRCRGERRIGAGRSSRVGCERRRPTRRRPTRPSDVPR